MWIELPAFWLTLLNLCAIPAIHLGVSWCYTGMPASWFDPESLWFRQRGWERGGSIYQSFFKIRSWKGMLPDAAPWFGGFAKGKLKEKDPSYIAAFIVETCRGEAAHYAQMAVLLATLIWNPWPIAALVMIIYALFSNLPCSVLQRYTRARLRRLRDQLEQRS
tara:strand:+ start:707 stop:1195 length:489 start_codon:yes stop_codon:yes gene_type:complete